MRIGKVLSYNKRAGVGLICDHNGERIMFFSKNISSIPSRGDIVTFEIHFHDGSLMVKEVAILKLSKMPRPVRLPGGRNFHNTFLWVQGKIPGDFKNEVI